MGYGKHLSVRGISYLKARTRQLSFEKGALFVSWDLGSALNVFVFVADALTARALKAKTPCG